MSGATSYHAGLAAEEAVAARYCAEGHATAARRWRSKAGEIDLIARDGDGFIFIEVKRARDFARAAERVSRRQLGRIWRAAELWLADAPNGANTNARVDVALVDGQGRIEILENVMAA